MPTFQVWYNGTRIDTMSIQFDPISQFGFVLPNKDANGMIVKFTLQGIDNGVTISNPNNE